LGNEQKRSLERVEKRMNLHNLSEIYKRSTISGRISLAHAGVIKGSFKDGG
jgi:hypothetical protein